MKDESRAAFVFSQAVACQAEILGMHSVNQDRLNDGLALAYDDTSFVQVKDAYRLSAEEVRTFLETGEYPEKGGAG